MPSEKRKTGGATAKALGRESANGVKKTPYSPNRWFHLVRILRTFYDHFRVAFPQMPAIPKYYTDEWCSEFGVTAQKFTKTENMEAVGNLLQGAGYGTEKWERVAGKPVEELARAIDVLLEVAESTEAGPGLKEGDQEKERVEAAEPEEEKLESAETLEEVTGAADGENAESSAKPVETAETASRAESNGHKSGNGELTAEVQRVREVLGPDRWNMLLEDPDLVIEAFDLHLGRMEKGEETEGEGKEADRSKFLSQKNEELLEEVNSLKKSLEGSKKEVRDQQVQIEDKNRQIQTLGEQLKRAQANVDKEKKQGRARKVEAPSEMANKLAQYEETLKANAATISRLESQAEKTGTELEELKASLQRGDLDSDKESNLATELEKMKETMNKQRSQLASLLGYSKNLKEKDEHLIRYVRSNYDKNFSPHHAFAPK